MGITITKDWLKPHSPCAGGYRWFLEHFPQGGAYADVQRALYVDKRPEDARWLAEALFRGEPTADATDAFVGAAVADVAELTQQAESAASGNYSQLAASGNDSRLAASGYYSQLAASGNYSQLAASGNYSQLAASGYYSQLAASGNYSQLAASGNDSRLAASGNDSRLAASGYGSQLAASGNGSRAKAGPNGAIALAWHDGKRPRFSVGYVGEGLEADTWYRLDDAGKFVKDEK